MSTKPPRLGSSRSAAPIRARISPVRWSATISAALMPEPRPRARSATSASSRAWRAASSVVAISPVPGGRRRGGRRGAGRARGRAGGRSGTGSVRAAAASAGSRTPAAAARGEDAVAAGARRLGRAVGPAGLGGLRQGDEEGRLGGRQAARLLAEPGEARGADALEVAAVGGEGEVEREDRVLVEPALEGQGDADLAELAGKRCRSGLPRAGARPASSASSRRRRCGRRRATGPRRGRARGGRRRGGCGSGGPRRRGAARDSRGPRRRGRPAGASGRRRRCRRRAARRGGRGRRWRSRARAAAGPWRRSSGRRRDQGAGREGQRREQAPRGRGSCAGATVTVPASVRAR